MKKTRTPQEKKESSYEKDKRGLNRENAKSTRKAIKTHKKSIIKSYRSLVHQAVKKNVIEKVSDSEITDLDSEIKKIKKKPWKKTPDIPLKTYISLKKKK